MIYHQLMNGYWSALLSSIVGPRPLPQVLAQIVRTATVWMEQ